MLERRELIEPGHHQKDTADPRGMIHHPGRPTRETVGAEGEGIREQTGQ